MVIEFCTLLTFKWLSLTTDAAYVLRCFSHCQCSSLLGHSVFSLLLCVTHVDLSNTWYKPTLSVPFYLPKTGKLIGLSSFETFISSAVFVTYPILKCRYMNSHWRPYTVLYHTLNLTHANVLGLLLSLWMKSLSVTIRMLAMSSTQCFLFFFLKGKKKETHLENLIWVSENSDKGWSSSRNTIKPRTAHFVINVSLRH